MFLLKKNTVEKFLIHLRDTLTIIVPFIFFIYWLYYREKLIILGDVAYLLRAAEFILSGKDMVGNFYDPNPPLCYILYIPAAILTFAGFQEHQAILIYISAVILFTAFIIYKYFKLTNLFSETALFTICVAFISISTFYFTSYTGFKDHFLACGLAGFITIQISKLSSPPPKNEICEYLCLLIFGIFILVKPHYLICPLCIMAFRAFKERNIFSFFGSDFFVIAISASAYALIVVCFFYDYINIILYDGIELYAKQARYNLSNYFLLLCYITFIFTLIINSKLKNKNLQLNLNLFILVMFTSFLPVILQNKGYQAHFIPTLILTYLAGTLILTGIIDQQKRINSKLLFMLFIFILNTCGVLSLSYSDSDSIENFQKKPLALLLKTHAGEQPFFFESYHASNVYPQSIHSGNFFASRFSSLWFFENTRNIPSENRDRIYTKYSNYIVEDLIKYKPKLLGFHKREENEQDMVVFLKKYNKNFEVLFKDYSFLETLKLKKEDGYSVIDEGETYNIYIKKD